MESIYGFWMVDEYIVNDMWMLDEWFIWSVLRVYMYVFISLNIILIDWMINECWMYGECNMIVL